MAVKGITTFKNFREAKASGDVRYFTGKSCKHGHISTRFVSSRRCASCVYAESKAKYRRDNPVLRREIKRRWREENLESILERKRRAQRKYYQKNKEKFLGYYQKETAIEQRRKWRLKNRSMILETNKKYRKENPEKVKNFPCLSPERHRESGRLWRLANPEKCKEIRIRRRARRQMASGSFTANDLKWIFSAQKGKCAYCRAKFGKKYHIDHIVALSKGGSNDKTNIQLTCKTCNLRKHAKDPIDFARECGKLI